jgi:predicted permease
MKWMSRLSWGRRRDEELDEEIQSHLRMAVQDRIERGETPEQAEASTRREFGNTGLVKEVTREMWGGAWLGQCAADLRFGLRMLRRSPAFSAVAILTLALGVGANTAIFSVVNAVLLRPLPFPQSEELVVIKAENKKTGERFPSVSPADFFDWKSQSRSFESLSAYSGWPITLLDADRPEMVPGTRVTDQFFHALQIRPQLGRVFNPEEFKAGSNVIILSHRLWQRRFGGDPEIIGKTLAVANGSVTVVGVMPQDFKLPASAETWSPVSQDSGEMRLRASRYFEAVARLKSNVTMAEAEGEMRTISARLASQYPESDANWNVRLVPLRETLIGDVRPALLILIGAVGLVLLIACANVANLLLARATTRYKELAIRSALGASRWRIIRQMVVESLLLSCLGGALGALLAHWCAGAIVWLVPKDLRFPRIEEAQVDMDVLGFTFAVILLIGVVLGLIQGLKASRLDLQGSIKEGGRNSTAGRPSHRVRNAVVVAEIALTLVLLAGAGLLIKSLLKLQHVELGFNQENLLIVPVSASLAKYAEPKLRSAYFERFVERVRGVPGVQSVATASCAPMMYTMYFPFAVEGQTNTNEIPQAWYNAVSPNYFHLMGIGVLDGREFTEHDRAGGLDVAVINETMRRRYFAGADVVGKHLTVNYLNTPTRFEIIGVVKDIKQESPGAEANAQIYVSDLQVPWLSTSLVIRTANDPGALLASLQQTIRTVDSTQSSTGAKSMKQLLSDSVAQPRFYVTLLGTFAVLALILAGVGIYGVISYAVTQRTHEIGIRIALGAQTRDVLTLVVGRGMVLVLIGTTIGLVSAAALTRVMRTMLYEVGTTDPVTFAGVTALLAMVALLACLIPAWRATKVEPMVALRSE